MKIECSLEDLRKYSDAQYRLGMIDDEDGISECVATYIDDMFVLMHAVKEHNEEDS